MLKVHQFWSFENSTFSRRKAKCFYDMSLKSKFEGCYERWSSWTMHRRLKRIIKAAYTINASWKVFLIWCGGKLFIGFIGVHNSSFETSDERCFKLHYIRSERLFAKKRQRIYEK